MRKILLLLAIITLTSCEDIAVSNGRKTYQKYYRDVLKDPESFTVYSEEYKKIDDATVSWTLDYGAKNSFGGMVREKVKFKTCGSSIFFEE